jgi:hypothetical protein
MTRAGLTAAAVATMAAALTFGLAGTASAATQWQLEVCSEGTYQTNVYYPGGSFGVPAGQCRTQPFLPQNSNAAVFLEVQLFVNNGNGVPIFSASVNITQGADLGTGGTASLPTSWSF